MSDAVLPSIVHKNVTHIAGSNAYCIAVPSEKLQDAILINNTLIDIEGRLIRVVNSVHLPSESNEYFAVFGVVGEPGRSEF